MWLRSLIRALEIIRMRRALDWERLLKEQRVPYITRGANVKRGELAIQCPFCGSADPSMHMGLNLETGWWSCWRNRSAHSGKSPLRLLMRLLGVTYGQARELAGLGDDYVDPEGFDAVAARVMGRNKDVRPEQVERRYLQMDPSFVPITSNLRTAKAWNYLYGRGFNRAIYRVPDVDALVEIYSLKTARSGDWQDRIILPYYQDRQLVTWSARAVASSSIRYKDLSIKESLVAPKETLFNHDCLHTGGAALVVVEGPFDALKLDFYGAAFGVRALALSTNSITDSQAFLLQAAGDKFASVYVMMDNATGLGIADSLRMKQALFFLPNVITAVVPYGKKDAGDLAAEEVVEWSNKIKGQQ